MHIGGYFIDNPIALAPMAGITDKPFRRICREFGAGWAVCEMLTSDPSLRHTKKTLRRSDFEGEGGVVDRADCRQRSAADGGSATV